VAAAQAVALKLKFGSEAFSFSGSSSNTDSTGGLGFGVKCHHTPLLLCLCSLLMASLGVDSLSKDAPFVLIGTYVSSVPLSLSLPLLPSLAGTFGACGRGGDGMCVCVCDRPLAAIGPLILSNCCSFWRPLIRWWHLRFVQRNTDGSFGDSSDDFAFVTLFPPGLRRWVG